MCGRVSRRRDLRPVSESPIEQTSFQTRTRQLAGLLSRAVPGWAEAWGEERGHAAEPPEFFDPRHLDQRYLGTRNRLLGVAAKDGLAGESILAGQLCSHP